MRTHQHTSLYGLTPASCGSDPLRSSSQPKQTLTPFPLPLGKTRPTFGRRRSFRTMLITRRGSQKLRTISSTEPRWHSGHTPARSRSSLSRRKSWKWPIRVSAPPSTQPCSTMPADVPARKVDTLMTATPGLTRRSDRLTRRPLPRYRFRANVSVDNGGTRTGRSVNACGLHGLHEQAFAQEEASGFEACGDAAIRAPRRAMQTTAHKG
jgi:hypothetical protein